LIADDTNYLIKAKYVLDLKVIAQNLILRIIEWGEMNGLIINATKTQATIFRPKNKTIDPIDLWMGNEKIVFVEHVKILGIIFSSDLSWSHHINNMLLPKLASINGITSRVRHLLPWNIKLQIYFSLFYSQLYYCLLVYGTGNRTCLNAIFIQQKKFLRTFLNLPRLAHSAPIFSDLKLIKVTQLYSYKLLRSISATNAMSQILLSFANPIPVPIIHNIIRNRSLYQIPFFRQEYCRQLICVQIPTIINSVQHTDILNSESLFVLKKRLKEFFLDEV